MTCAYIIQYTIQTIQILSTRPNGPICHLFVVDNARNTQWFEMSTCDVVTLGQVWCLIVSIPDFCPLSHFQSEFRMAN